MAGKDNERCFPGWHPQWDRPDAGSPGSGARWGLLVLLVLIFLAWASAAQAASGPAITLTSAEQEWLRAYPDIRLAYPPGHEPTLMEDEDGTLIGVLADYYGLINSRLGTNLKPTLIPWLEVDDKIRKREIEGLVAATPKKVEALGLLPTQKMFSSYVVVYGKSGNDSLNFPDDLYGRRVTVLSGFNHTDIAVDQIRDKAEIIAVKSPRAGLEAVHQNRADFFIGAISNNYLVSKYQLFGIGALHVFWDQPYRAGPAVRADLPELADILEKGANLITDEEFDTMVARWTRVRRTEIRVELTPDERIWLDQHPNIELGYTDVFEPGIIVNEDGSYSGTLVDILELLNQRLGTDFNPTAKSIPELIRQVNDKELAGVLSIHSDRADKLGWLRTKSYMNSYPTIFTRKGFTFTGPSDLAGKKIALIDKVFFSRNLVDLYGAGSKLIKVKDGREGLETVRSGKADLYVGSSRNSYLLSKYQFYDLTASFQFYEHPTPNVMAIRNDWPQLVSILNKGMESITAEEIESILEKWGSVSIKQHAVDLTPEEQSWLKENPRIGVGVSPIPPYMFSEKGRAKGYLIDMLERIVIQVGLAADYSIKPMEENLSMVKSGDLQTILGMIHNEERAGFMYFSENVMNMQMAVFAPTSRSDISDADSLEDKVLASYKGYGFEPVIRRVFPNATIIQADDAAGMLRLVASGEADAAVQELYSGEYILRDNFINGVSRKGSFALPGLPLITGSEFGVSKKYPLLNSILNKAYDVLTESEKARVWRKWFADDTAEKELVELTDEEKSWIAANPKIVLGTDSSWAPYVILGEDGSLAGGVDVDFINLLNKKLGTNIQLTTGNWNEIVEQGKTREIDGLTTSAPLETRLSHFLFSNTYLRTFKYIVTRKDAAFDVHSLKDLVGLRVATQKGIGFDRKLLDEVGNVTLVESANHSDSIDLVLKGEADAALVGSGAPYRLSENQMSGIIFAYWVKDEPLSFVYSIRNDWPEFLNIINKGIAAISETERSEILKKYYLEPQQDDVDLKLSVDEKAWLYKNNNVRVRATDWPPYMIIKENESPQGIAVEYLKLIKERTGINFEYDVTDQPFGDFLESMKQNQGPDLTALIVKDPEREQYLSFTAPYVSSPYVIFAREQDDMLLDINGLTGKTLAVPRGFVIQAQLARDYPDIRQALFDSDEQALRAVATGQVDAYIGNLTVASHIIHQHGLSDLRVVAPSPFVEQSLSMGNRKDWPELTTILNKALASITEAEKTAIRSKYVALRYEQGVDRADVMRWILIVVGGAFGIVIIFVFWNRSLAKRVRQRTLELERTADSLQTEIEERNRTETALEISRRFTDNLVETANVMIVGLDNMGNVNLFNPAAEKITGYTISELHGKNWFEFLTPKERYPQVHAEFSRLIAGGLPKSFQNHILTKTGEERVISWSNNEIKNGNQIAGTLSIGIDITSGIQAEQEILQYQQRLKALASQLTIAEEKERSKIAADLHDHVGHSLALARMQLNGILESESHLERKILVKDISNIMLQALQDTRSLIFDLSSPSMNEIGLGAAISEWLEEQIEKRHGLKTEFSDQFAEEQRGVLDKTVRALMFRNMRELLTNVVKHARANKVRVSMRKHTNGVEVIVEDDGRGFDPEAVKTRNGKPGGFGLFSIQERMSDLGGTFDIQSAPDKGCRAVLTVPLGKENSALNRRKGDGIGVMEGGTD